MPKCKNCNKQRGSLSQRKLCKKCSSAIQTNVIAQMKAKEGFYYDKWKSKTLEYAKRIQRE